MATQPASATTDDGGWPSMGRRAVLHGTGVGLLGLTLLATRRRHDRFRAVQDGAWSDPGTWEGGEVPTDGAHVSIPDSVTVTVADEITTRVAHLSVRGTLRHAPDRDTQLRVGTIETHEGSRYEVGTAAEPVEAGVTAHVEFIDEGPIDEDRWPDRRGRGLLAHGEVEVVGATTTPWTTLASHPRAGDTTLDLAEAPTNWSAGDRLVVPGIEPYESADLSHTDEERTVASVDGTTVTLDAPLDHDHVPPRDEFASYVLHLTRNVVLSSENTDVHRRGHVMLMNTGTDVRYVRLDELGRTDKSRPLTDPPRNADTVPDRDDPNDRARYPFHYHLTGIGAEPHRAEGLVVDGSPGWGIVNHHAHAHVSDSITYDVRGAGFVAEGGNERGSFERCFALRSSGSGETIDVRAAGAHGGDPPIDDFGHAGHGFWLQSPLVEVVDNVAAGHRHQAFVWWLRPLLDGDMAECSDVEDSRVTFCPNLPVEYVDKERHGPLLEAIQVGRFSHNHDSLMRESGKIPSTFAAIETISGNEAFASGGGVDFSRHNFKWKHERFSDFSVIDDMTVHSIGTVVDEHGEEHSPDLPRHRASGHQGRGGDVGISLRYTSNVSITNSTIIGTGRKNSVGVPFHDYQWTNVIENCTIENWDWGVDTGEHRIDIVRDCSFAGNNYDVNWWLDNVGPAILEDNDIGLVRNTFARNSQKASETFNFGHERGVRIDGKSTHYEASAPEYVPFPDESSLSGVNNLDTVFEDPGAIVGMTNAELLAEYGVAVGSGLLPDDAEPASIVEGSRLVSYTERDPQTSVYLGEILDSSGSFRRVTADDVANGYCLEWTGSDSPKEDAATVAFQCAAGTYEVFFRARPNGWNGDDVYFRVDDGEWKTAEKLKSPVGFGWHGASPNNENNYTFSLEEGSHTLEFACDSSTRIDEIFVTSDDSVLGGYGMSLPADGPSFADYITDDGETTTELLRQAADDWRDGEVSTDLLRDVLCNWHES